MWLLPSCLYDLKQEKIEYLPYFTDLQIQNEKTFMVLNALWVFINVIPIFQMRKLTSKDVSELHKVTQLGCISLTHAGSHSSAVTHHCPVHIQAHVEVTSLLCGTGKMDALDQGFAGVIWEVPGPSQSVLIYRCSACPGREDMTCLARPMRSAKSSWRKWWFK